MVDFDLWMSTEMVDSEVGVKLERGLGGGWSAGFIQDGSTDGVFDEANCWWMVVILVVKNWRKAVQV